MNRRDNKMIWRRTLPLGRDSGWMTGYSYLIVKEGLPTIRLVRVENRIFSANEDACSRF
jgi:hypothetical protein